jgi:hypothetical protein
MDLIKKLLNEINDDDANQIILINEMIKQYDLPFDTSYLHDVYKFIIYVINNVDIDAKLMQNYFTGSDFMYRPDKNREFLNYFYNYDSNKYRTWLTSHVIYLLGTTLENDKDMHCSVIRSVEKKELKIQHFEHIMSEKYQQNVTIRCNNESEVIDTFKILLNNGLFDYKKYCKKDTVKLILESHVSEIMAGSYTKCAK